MRTSRFLFNTGTFLLCCVTSTASFAQSVDFGAIEAVDTALTIGSPYPALFENASIDGSDYLEATLDIEGKGATVSWAPLLLTNKYYPVISESRIAISSKDKITSLGLSVKYNPFNARSPRGLRTRPSGINPSQSSQIVADKKFRIAALEKQVFQEITHQPATTCPETIEFLKSAAPTDPTVVLTSDQHSKLKCALIKAKDKLARLDVDISGTSDLNERARLKAEKKKWSGPYANGLIVAERMYIREHTASETADSRTPSALTQLRASIAALKAEVSAADQKRSASLYLDYRKKLLSGYVPTVSLSYISSFFEVVGEGNFDADNDGNIDNEFSVKSRALSLSADWRFNEKNQLSLLLSRSEERASPEAGSPKADYDGIGATWAFRVRVLNKDSYTKSKDFKESLFVPSINVGLSFEQRECDSPNSDCANGVLKTEAITPFVDFRLNKKAQFRIGIPFKKSRIFAAGSEGDEDTVELRALVTIQLGSPN